MFFVKIIQKKIRWFHQIQIDFHGSKINLSKTGMLDSYTFAVYYYYYAIELMFFGAYNEERTTIFFGGSYETIGLHCFSLFVVSWM